MQIDGPRELFNATVGAVRKRLQPHMSTNDGLNQSQIG